MANIQIIDGKYIKVAEKYINYTTGQIKRHHVKLLGIMLASTILDNVRIRIAREKDKTSYERDSVNYKKILCRHEAEIKAYKDEAKKSRQALDKVMHLEKVVQQITKGECSEEKI